MCKSVENGEGASAAEFDRSLTDWNNNGRVENRRKYELNILNRLFYLQNYWHDLYM